MRDVWNGQAKTGHGLFNDCQFFRGHGLEIFGSELLSCRPGFTGINFKFRFPAVSHDTQSGFGECLCHPARQSSLIVLLYGIDYVFQAIKKGVTGGMDRPKPVKSYTIQLRLALPLDTNGVKSPKNIIPYFQIDSRQRVDGQQDFTSSYWQACPSQNTQEMHDVDGEILVVRRIHYDAADCAAFNAPVSPVSRTRTMSS